MKKLCKLFLELKLSIHTCFQESPIDKELVREMEIIVDAVEVNPFSQEFDFLDFHANSELLLVGVFVCFLSIKWVIPFDE